MFNFGIKSRRIWTQIARISADRKEKKKNQKIAKITYSGYRQRWKIFVYTDKTGELKTVDIEISKLPFLFYGKKEDLKKGNIEPVIV